METICKLWKNIYLIFWKKLLNYVYLYQTTNNFRTYKTNQMRELETPIKTYAKSELAQLYNPTMTIRCALRTFRQWILFNKELYSNLQNTGYHDSQRYFTPRQVELIFHYLGKP